MFCEKGLNQGWHIHNSIGECNTVLGAYTMYRHLEERCPHLSTCIMIPGQMQLSKVSKEVSKLWEYHSKDDKLLLCSRSKIRISGLVTFGWIFNSLSFIKLDFSARDKHLDGAHSNGIGRPVTCSVIPNVLRFTPV